MQVRLSRSYFIPSVFPQRTRAGGGRGGNGGAGSSIVTFCSMPPTQGQCSSPHKGNVCHNTLKSSPSKGKTMSNTKIVTVGMSSFIVMSSLSIAHMHMDVLDINNSLLLGSYGASCFLLCLSPEAPIAQPRNVMGGHLVGASCGLLSHSLMTRFQTTCDFGGITLCPEIDYLVNTCAPVMFAGPLAVSSACMLMMWTRTVHFPAAGTALATALTPTTTTTSVPASTSLNDTILGPEVVALLANVCFSSATLVALACLIYKGSYPHKIDRL